jgi:hypothetical protein
MAHGSIRDTIFSEDSQLAGHLAEASTQAREAFALARIYKERGSEAWTLRLLGDLDAQHEPPQIEPAEDGCPTGPSSDNLPWMTPIWTI